MFAKTFFVSVCVLCVSFFSVACAVAQEIDTLQYSLQEAVIVGDDVAGGDRSSVPLQVVRRSSIENLGLLNLSDAVKRMSGVDVRDYGGVGGLKTVSVRGMGAKHTAVSYDGVVVSDAQSGVVDLGRFPLENIEVVSLVIGEDKVWAARTARESASSSLLSLKTMRSRENMAYVKLQGGTFGYADVSAFANYASYAKSFKGASLFANYMRSDGMYPFTLVNGDLSSREKRKDGDISSVMLESNFDFVLWKGSLSAKMHYCGSERGLPGAVNIYNKDNRERLWNRNFFAQAVYRKNFGDYSNLQAVLKYDYNYSRYRELNVNYASGEQVDINRQNETYASVAFQDRFAKSFGYSVATDVSYATLANNFGEAHGPGRFSSYTALMLSHWWSRGEVQAGLFALYASDDVSGGKSPAPYRRLSPSFSLLYKPFLNVPLRVCLSFKDSYRVPTFADLYYLRLGNVGLKPERATLYNVGLLWNDCFEVIGKVGVRVDAYYNSVRDKIVALPTMYIWRMVNFGKAEMFGVDVNVSWYRNFAERYSLSCNLNYSWQYAVDVTDKSAKNYRDQLPYTPSHSGNLTLVFENPIVNVSYMLSCVGERYMLPQNTAKNRMSGYFEHSFSVNREFVFDDTKLRLQGELLNVGDKSYEVIRYYPMSGFSWRLSARLSF